MKYKSDPVEAGDFVHLMYEDRPEVTGWVEALPATLRGGHVINNDAKYVRIVDLRGYRETYYYNHNDWWLKKVEAGDDQT